jgi:flavin-binding protein dodecin
MSKVVKVIEVLAESESSWEDAAKAALAEAAKTVRHNTISVCREFRRSRREWKDYDLQNQR